MIPIRRPSPLPFAFQSSPHARHPVTGAVRRRARNPGWDHARVNPFITYRPGHRRHLRHRLRDRPAARRARRHRPPARPHRRGGPGGRRRLVGDRGHRRRPTARPTARTSPVWRRSRPWPGASSPSTRTWTSWSTTPAIAAPERHTVTADGNEIAFQVNFLAHYLLTCLLEPALTSDPGGRVVNVSSVAAPHRLHPVERPAARPPLLPARRIRPVPAGADRLRRRPPGHRRLRPPRRLRHRSCSRCTRPARASQPPRAPPTSYGCATRRPRSSTAPTTTATSASSPAPAATEDRTVRRLSKLADLLVGRTA